MIEISALMVCRFNAQDDSTETVGPVTSQGRQQNRELDEAGLPAQAPETALDVRQPLMKTIVLTHRAAKDLDGLPAQARVSVQRALNGYAVSGQGDIKKLKGQDGYRMRVGNYRILFAEDATTILAVYFGRRATTTYR